MQFRLTSEQDKPIFEGWNSSSRLEERTCRPIINGKRATPADHVVALTFFQDEIDNPEPVGRFMYFDVNPRNRSAEFGYIVSPEHRQRRIGTKMLTQSLDHVFSTTSLNKLYCQTSAFKLPRLSSSKCWVFIRMVSYENTMSLTGHFGMTLSTAFLGVNG